MPCMKYARCRQTAIRHLGTAVCIRTFGQQRFTILRSMKARRCAHSSALEATAVVLAMKRLANRGRLHAHRLLLLIDAKAVGALRLQEGPEFGEEASLPVNADGSCSGGG